MFSGQQQCANLLNLPAGPLSSAWTAASAQHPPKRHPVHPTRRPHRLQAPPLRLAIDPRGDGVGYPRRQGDAELADATARSHRGAAGCPDG